ncbi:hypothetical protein HW532_04260 [Kaustia mangrovi]|uniref:HK97 gp10 family phage protein n=1 Tax=Kaustia mangrovi TaxID=2593653 RepID=A0A7S8C252_9HYPH|nr:hypothetical protein [Kaustia mangrovi]QPC41995.1 hypothetical protein HW532_04260 [Kaustia mangrovi]
MTGSGTLLPRRRLEALLRSPAVAAALGEAAGAVRREAGAMLDLATASGTARGRLVRSLAVTVDPAAGEVRIASTVPEAAAREFGSSAMPADPWLAPALSAARGEVRAILREGLKAAIRQAPPIKETRS